MGISLQGRRKALRFYVGRPLCAPLDGFQPCETGEAAPGQAVSKRRGGTEPYLLQNRK